MNRKRFNHIIEHRMDKSKEVFASKNDEYASEEEVFKNFKQAVGISFNNTPEKVAWEFLTKHLQSIKDIMVDLEMKKVVPKSLLDEKMNDAHNYLYLIEGIIQEKIDNEYREESIGSMPHS